MKDRKLVWFFLLSAAILVSGCAKKASEPANIPATGFDSATATPATTTEELNQLPAASTTTTQQPAVEALPVEASPVTQAASATASTASEAISGKALSREMEIQTALKNSGLYNGKIDGKLGPASKKAVAEFQKQNGLKADGKVGPKTWAALSAHLNGSSAAPAASEAAPATSTTDAPAGKQ